MKFDFLRFFISVFHQATCFVVEVVGPRLVEPIGQTSWACSLAEDQDCHKQCSNLRTGRLHLQGRTPFLCRQSADQAVANPLVGVTYVAIGQLAHFRKVFPPSVVVIVEKHSKIEHSPCQGVDVVHAADQREEDNMYPQMDARSQESASTDVEQGAFVMCRTLTK